MDTCTLKVKGLHCGEEVKTIEQALSKKPGIQKVICNILEETVYLEYDSSTISERNIKKIIIKLGFPIQEKTPQKENFWKKYKQAIVSIISGALVIIGLLHHYILHGEIESILSVPPNAALTHVSVIFFIIATIIGAWFVFPKALLSLKRLQPDMNLLMVIAIIGAMTIGQWFEAASVAFLFSVALSLEQWTLQRARRAIASLMELSPKTAYVLQNIDSQEGKSKNVEELKINDLILIKPGEKVPIDAVVIKGQSSIDQSPITGESIPVQKDVEDEVFAGTINHDGLLTCKVTKLAQNTTLSKIIELVKNAQAKKAYAEEWVIKFAKVYTPIMICFAIATALIPPLLLSQAWDTWIYRALVILVIACPCALVISTPVSIVSGLTTCARNGLLVKGGLFLELPSKLRAIAFDKTGTLTQGQPEVQNIIPLNNHSEDELLLRAASLEQGSSHPLARAILNKAEEKGIQLIPATSSQNYPGKGIEANLNGKRYWLGSHRFCHEKIYETESVHEKANELEDAGHSVVIIGTEQHICGIISIADQPREEIPKILRDLKREGIEKTVMLTGDNQATADALAKWTKVDEYYAELLPEDKVSKLQALVHKSKFVAMVGDGINDAPAMALATLGISMGAIGTDVAIETSDIALMSDDLSKLPWLIKHSKRTLKIIQQNIFFALALKALFIFLGLIGDASLWMAIAADTGASLVVIFNALRLLKV